MDIEKRTGTFDSFDGTPVYFETRGTGRPLVFVYGIACTTNQWRHQVRYFSEKYQTVMLDYRGHHRTPIPKDRDQLSLDALAKDLKCLAEYLKLEKPIFVGHSFGVQVLIRCYDMYPDLFGGAVFINGFATNPLSANVGGELGASLFRFVKDGYDQLPQTLSYLWKLVATNPIALHITALAGGFNLNLTSFKDIEIYARGVASIELDVFLTLFDQMLNYNGINAIENISVPTLIIGGSKDTVTPVSFQETLHKKIKGSELTIIPYGSHCTQLDLPDFVNLKIEQFLKKNNY